jgi:hypothetical protein
LPPDAALAKLARTHVYGYLSATVSAAGTNRADPIRFDFREVSEPETPADVVQRFGAEFVHRCYQENAKD